MNLLTFAVIPVLVGPLQVLLALLPGLLLAAGAGLLAMLRPRAIWLGLKLLWRQKIVVAAIVAVLLATVFLARAFFFTGETQVSRAEATSQSWPMFRGGLARRGSIDGSAGPDSGGLHWSFLGGGPTYYSTPTVVGNRLYVTSADKGPFRDRGAIYCLDADTGGLAWSVAPRGFRATFSSPAVSGRFLVCGEGLHYTDNARIVCLDLQRDPKILWAYRTSSHVESSPCIDQGRVYIGAGDDGYYCLQLEPDADGRPVVVWHADGQEYPDAETSPAVCDDRVVVGLGMGGKAVCCLHADTGDELWRVDAPYPVFGPPSIVEDRVFVGMGNGNFVQSAEQVRQIELQALRKQGANPQQIAVAEEQLGPIGQVWCLDLQTGEVAWKFDVGRTILGAVAAGDGRVYFGSRDGYVYCVSFDGREVARWNAHAPIVTSPAVTADHVYAVTETGKLYGLSVDELELEWEATLSFRGPFLGSPTVARGRVYIGSPQDGLLCLGQAGSKQREPMWEGALGGPGQGGCIDDEPLPERGKFAWRYPAGDDATAPAKLHVTAAVACLGDRVYVPVHGQPNGLVCLRDDPESRAGPAKQWMAESPHGVYLSPAATNDAAFFVDGRPGDSGRRLRAMNPRSGVVRWELSVASEAPGEFVLWEDGGLIANRSDAVTCFDFDGSVVWTSEVGRVRSVPAVGETMTVVVTDDPARLTALDLTTGRMLWQTALDDTPATGPVLCKAAVCVGSQSGVTAFRLVDGGLLWESQGGTPVGPLTLRKGRLAYVRVPNDAGESARAELVIMDADSGKVSRTVPEVLSHVPPLLSRDALLVAGESGLLRCSAETEKTQLWMRTEWLGPVISPVVMARSRVYFGTRDRGLVCAVAKRRR